MNNSKGVKCYIKNGGSSKGCLLDSVHMETEGLPNPSQSQTNQAVTELWLGLFSQKILLKPCVCLCS